MEIVLGTVVCDLRGFLSENSALLRHVDPALWQSQALDQAVGHLHSEKNALGMVVAVLREQNQASNLTVGCLLGTMNVLEIALVGVLEQSSALDRVVV